MKEIVQEYKLPVKGILDTIYFINLKTPYSNNEISNIKCLPTLHCSRKVRLSPNLLLVDSILVEIVTL